MSAARWLVAMAVVCSVGACATLVANRGSRATAPARSVASTAPTSPATESQEPRATLTVTVKGLRNRKGDLIFGVFRSADGFPNQEAKAINWQVKPAGPGAGAGTVSFTASLPPGRYAASVLHDENRSGEMNRNFANVPVEGYGVTNNPKPAFRAATFEEAAFELPAAGREMTISAQYF